ncbi:hypothetical protein M436DRAFT_47676 [Aureobasidium namibiae CBS 147.97]|uniref:Biogenesis of lysosome-related organelles complex 1 subunit CNL1 n=1 Tax=Aureobasidium namibiae CBS 147.97 TaxID=1043004 RepID=A0A074WID3_9PEZI|nr:uncharacterized protein M436DRAFT_47676 [Aureobasidium namibiae CBS 147.97]KEQ72890.1 hypothetical protein M436DRAFT_47676 [Aureobasidium namibiae CBS 147.97]
MVSKKPSSSSSRAAAPTASSTVAPSQLGLTNGEEIATFQRHQQVALSRANNSIARTAAANGRVLVDASNLMLLANYFDHVMAGIQQRADLLTRQTQASVQRQSSRAVSSIQAANAEIARVHSLLRQIDELEAEFDKIRRIRDIVAAFRSRVEALERRVR